MRKVHHGLWRTRTVGSKLQKGQHFMIHAQKAPMAPAVFKGRPFASAHPIKHREAEDFKKKAISRLQDVVARAKVYAASGTPSGIDRALRLLEREFKVGIHPGQAFGSHGISEIQDESFFRKAKDRIISARLLLNESIYSDDENRRTALLEEAASSILNIDAEIPYVSKAPLPREAREEPRPVKIYVRHERPRRTRAEKLREHAREAKAAAEEKPEEKLEDKIRGIITEGRLAKWRRWETKAEEKAQAEEAREAEAKILEQSAATRESARRALEEEQ